MESSKDKYFQLLYKNKLPDIFHVIPELSYTQKLKIVQNLLQKYPPLIVEHALCEYDMYYIQNDRVNLEIIFSVLKGICERIKNSKL